MPVRMLYKDMKNEPAPLVVDLFINTIIPSIDEDSRSVFKKIVAPLKYKPEATDEDLPESWRNVKNTLFFSNGYAKMFNNTVDGLWVAYYALSKIFQKYTGPDYQAPYMQVFVYGRKKFWVVKEADHIIFTRPEEY